MRLFHPPPNHLNAPPGLGERIEGCLCWHCRPHSQHEHVDFRESVSTEPKDAWQLFVFLFLCFLGPHHPAVTSLTASFSSLSFGQFGSNFYCVFVTVDRWDFNYVDCSVTFCRF
ncbi:hypothetical protein ILYODFUR_004370 [Ilyodon furcidens]|uniref:Uncharacterized protein n=1 Tax=Ilyodon furcidens TaxID=33524 RepID=A0ABV0UEN7_9TELE